MNIEDFDSRRSDAGITAFGYGKPENFSGYSPRYHTVMYGFGEGN